MNIARNDRLIHKLPSGAVVEETVLEVTPSGDKVKCIRTVIEYAMNTMTKRREPIERESVTWYDKDDLKELEILKGDEPEWQGKRRQ